MHEVSSAIVRRYWDTHIHDLDMTTHPAGSLAFFEELDAYHFEKLHHLLRLVDFTAWRERRVLDVGCGTGVEVVRFGRGGAHVFGVDLSEQAVRLTRQNVAEHGTAAALAVADGECLPFPNESMDFVYAHGVVQYAGNDHRVVQECHRVLKPGGLALFQAYNRRSWLQVLSKVMRVPLEHEDAPVLRRYSIGELRQLLRPFASTEIIPERFPVKSRIHKGWKGMLYNVAFVGAFNALPRAWISRWGWHLIARCRK